MAASIVINMCSSKHFVMSIVLSRALQDVCRRKKQSVASLSNHYRRCYSSNSNILTLSERGIFKDIFPVANSDLPKILTSEPQCLYCGFDPTASSLHIGNLLAIIALLHCQRAGHRPIALIGGATALVGDPSGKTKEREPLQSAVVQSNAASIKDSLERIFTNHERYFWKESKPLPQIRIMDNHSWYKDINVISFLSGVGRKLRMGTLLSRQSVQTRLASNQGMNFAEFSYQLFQAYDFLHLHREHGCLIQLGGTDQLGNLMTGHDLVKKVTGKDVYGIAIPLVTSSTGAKLGKTAGNAVWVNEDKTSPLDLYQYFVRLPDADMERYLKLFTFLPLNEIDDIITKHKKTPKNRKAQEKLAEQVLLLVHGESGLDKAIRQTDALYSTERQSLEQLNATEITELFRGASITSLLLEPGYSVGQLLDRLKCLPQGYRGEKILQGGGVYINHQRVTRADQVLINGEHILNNNLTLVRIGKKNYYVVKWV
ncbi:tyrosine--tRNA ligase, mitochondrial-like [Asterias rubens]|uniref:tyrosine--tRNA ligase, mitochondrial-like n=1 Tax=Asterias rubens TaxID=7604 RepID=UPI0014553CEB|nr:tyrosine--tRNA ligase, mitochondrial-like [Asterias rubens]